MTTQPTRRLDNGELNSAQRCGILSVAERAQIVESIERADEFFAAKARTAELFAEPMLDDPLLDNILVQCSITARYVEKWNAGDISDGVWCAMEGALSSDWHK